MGTFAQEIALGGRHLLRGAQQAGIHAKEGIARVASKAGNGLHTADNFVKANGGLKDTAKHLMKERPVTTLAVTGSAVAGTAVIGGHALGALGRGRSEERAR